MILTIRVITKLPNSEQSNKGKVKTHKYINTKIIKVTTFQKVGIKMATIAGQSINIGPYGNNISL
jgi:hypothetical protein